MLSVLLTILGCPRVPEHLQLDEGSFGYVNADGTELLTLDSLRNPTRIRAALCPRGRVVRVAYTRRQSRQTADNGRQTAANFSNDFGDVFRTEGGKASADETCYLSADSVLLAAASPLELAQRGACDTVQIHRIAEAKRRSVLHCWPLGAALRNVQIVAVQFVVIDTSALASLVVLDEKKLYFRDFPATYRGPEESTWRVDDGGEFSPESFGILFFCRLQGVYVMAFTWAGAEGEDSYLDIADSADTFRSRANAYRYWVPE
jgi:hypothetical protein